MDYWPLPPPKLIYRVVLKTDIPRCCSRCPKKLIKVLGKMLGITKIDMEKYGGGFVEVEGPVEGKVIQRLLNDKLCKNVYMVESELILKNFKSNGQGGTGRTLKTVDARRTHVPKPESDQVTRRTVPAPSPRRSDASTEARRKGKAVAETSRNKSYEQGMRSQGGVVIREPAVRRSFSGSSSSSSSSSSSVKPMHEAGERSTRYASDDSSSAGGYWTPQYEPHEEMRSDKNRNNGGKAGGENIIYYGDFGGYGNHDHLQSGSGDGRGWIPPQHNVPPPPQGDRNHATLYFNEENAESSCSVM